MVNGLTFRSIAYSYITVENGFELSYNRIDGNYMLSNIHANNDIYSYEGPYAMSPINAYSFGNVILLTNSNTYYLFNPKTKTIKYTTFSVKYI